MACYGQSRHTDKINTYKERSRLKRIGKTTEEQLSVNYMKDKIYSYSTMKTYQKEITRFGDWLIEKGHKRISLSQVKEHIQEYIDYQTDRGLTPDSVNTSLSAICKATHADISDYRRPRRSVAKITRGTGERKHDSYNEKKFADVLNANRLLGLRRNELKNLRVRDIIERDDAVIVKSRGKGGKDNEQLFIFSDEKEKVMALTVGKAPDDYVFEREAFKNDCDFHHMRELRAKDLYKLVLSDINVHPENATYYQTIIKDIFKRHRKRLREDFSKPFVVRGPNKKRLEKEGRETEFDRTAVLFVSVTVLSHYRSDTTVEHYIGK